MSRPLPSPPAARRRTRWHRRIRARFVVASVLLVAGSLAVVIAVTRHTLIDRLDRQIEADMAQEIEELRILVDGTDPESGEPFGDDVEAIFDVFLRRNLPALDEAFYALVDGEPYLTSFDAPRELFEHDLVLERWGSTTEPTRLDLVTEHGEVRSLAVPLFAGDGGVAGVFVVAFFPADDLDEIAQTVRVLLLAGLGAVIVAALVAWSLAGRVVRPIRELTTTAHSLSDRDLTRRIPVDGDDEVAELGHTFNDLMDRLDAGFTAQRRFLDDVAHELRTPITIARGHLELVSDDPDEVRATVDLVDDELEQMGRYVADLLVLAKSEQPDFLRPELVDLVEVVDEVVGAVDALATRRWVRDDDTPPGSALTVADPARIRQAMLNLASNAVQHTGDGAEIGIGLTVIHDHPDGAGAPSARLHVRDTGPGVDPDVADSLFDRTHRGATSRARRPEGTGIGLSIVDAIARAHRGQVTVISDPGRGATFTIELPLQIDAPTIETPTIASPTPETPTLPGGTTSP